MTRRQIGAMLMILGGVLVIFGVVLKLSASGQSEPEPVASVTTTIESAPPTESTVPAPEAPTTTVEAPTTTTTQTTSTTVSPVDQVSAFIAQFSDAIDSGDESFVNGRLHPGIVDGFGADVCASWVNTEIMALSDYQLTGEIVGPTTGSLETPSGLVEFPDRYSAPVSFTFGGQSFTTTADFVVLDGAVYFTGSCQ